MPVGDGNGPEVGAGGGNARAVSDIFSWESVQICGCGLGA